MNVLQIQTMPLTKHPLSTHVMSIEPLSVLDRAYLHYNFVQNQPIVFEPTDCLCGTRIRSREWSRERGVVTGIEPPAPTITYSTTSTIPHIVVPVPRGERRAVVLQDESVVGQVSHEAVQVEFEVL